jgi:hypothetical protein
MKPNEGGVDRILRVLLGLGILAPVFVGPKTLWTWLGLPQTGLVGFARSTPSCASTPWAARLDWRFRPFPPSGKGLGDETVTSSCNTPVMTSCDSPPAKRQPARRRGP